MSCYKLNYFDARGIAEISRMLFAVANVEYTDNRFPTQGTEFKEAKELGEFDVSLKKLPYLEVDGVKVCQSKSIERFLAFRFGLMGITDIEHFKVDSLCECIRDFKDMYQKVRKLPDDEKDAGMKSWFTETLPERLNLLEKLVAQKHTFFDDNDIVYSVGNGLTLADIVIYIFLVEFFDDKEGVTQSYKECSNLKAIVKTVGNIPQIKRWVKERPVTAF
tara:strand:- start:59 stop:715 length:657 start_codon:yes stop_codon:yes gene_type:complete